MYTHIHLEILIFYTPSQAGPQKQTLGNCCGSRLLEYLVQARWPSYHPNNSIKALKDDRMLQNRQNGSVYSQSAAGFQQCSTEKKTLFQPSPGSMSDMLLGWQAHQPWDTCTAEHSIHLHQRCADCGRGYPRTRICRFSCGRGRSADPPNKHICGCRPSADLKPRVLFAWPTSNGSANVPVLSNLRTDPYLDNAVGYVRNYLRMRTVRGHELPLQLRTRTVRGPDACRHGLSADVKFVDPHTSDLHITSKLPGNENDKLCM